MRLLAFAKGRLKKFLINRVKKQLLSIPSEPKAITRQDWNESLSDPVAFYKRCFRYFYHQAPTKVREHRAYFNMEGRGFGEDVFHVMWLTIFQELKPKNFLEIGVFRGQVISLLALLQKEGGVEGEVVGISPFLPAGDEVSIYREDVRYMEDTLSNFNYFGLTPPTLVKAFSTDMVAAETIGSRLWDLIYIDGSHDYDVVKSDWALCSRYIREGGFIVLDDSGLNTKYKPLLFSTGGHPGPSRLAQEIISDGHFREILQVGHNRVFTKPHHKK